MSHGLLGDISMVAPVPRRDACTTVKDAGAPPKLCEQSITPGTPAVRAQPKRPPSSTRRLNQLQKSCYYGVPAGAEPPPEAEHERGLNKDGLDGTVWMGSGFMERKQMQEHKKPRFGDGTGDGHEERCPLQPWFFNCDSTLLERRHHQSGLQCVSRVMRDHNRGPRDGPKMRSADKILDEKPSTFIQQHPKSPSPALGKGEVGGHQLLCRSPSSLRASSANKMRSSSVNSDAPGANGSEKGSDEGVVYARNYGVQKDGSKTRNWQNEEFGIFPGCGHSTGALHRSTKKAAREYTSSSILQSDKRTHCRSPVPLPDKYTKPVTEAQVVGWNLRQAEWHDNQQFPRMRCYFTAYDQDLKKGGVQDQLVLRRLGMKC